ncbi:serine hydrolase domain-containing protein [Paradevosia shaoguanensis]|uniref:serine hydrolase domain-containing protein n=1 Tax=Paradevosia shaoguanensis TaxID=1335043 RepID=UPI003C743517
MDLQTRLDGAIDGAISRGRIVGAVLLLARHGEVIYRRAAGHFDREAGKPMREDAIFRLASVTKPLVAATALAQVERGLLGLDNAVADYLPYFRPRLADGTEPAIRIRHLLTHTSGLGYEYPGDPEINTGLLETDFDFEENFTRLAGQPLFFEPGSRWEYSLAVDVLGAIVAGVHGSTLHDALAHYITGPLQMRDTGFHVTDNGRLAPPYADASPQPIRMPDPHTVTNSKDESTSFSPGRIFNRRAFQSGGAGAVGTADDLLRFFEAIRTGGTPILLNETVAQAVQNQISDVPRREEDAGRRFGWLGSVLVDPSVAGSPQGAGTIDWGGIYGHSWFVDPVAGYTMISMTNTAVEGCTGSYPDEIIDAIYDRQPD